MLLPLLLTAACQPGSEAESTSASDTASSPLEAARAGFEVWAEGRSGDVRLVAASQSFRGEDEALVVISADIRDDPSSEWTLVHLNVPVSRVEDRWEPPPPTAFEQAVAAARPRTVATAQRASPTAETPPESAPATAIPAEETIVPLPAPAAGEVIYAADWSSGLDGWIGPSEWSAGGGYLANSGAISTLDPWIEAPVRVDPGRDMAVEFEAEVQAQEFGSFGLVARAGPSGMFLVGFRSEEPGQEGVVVSAFIDAMARGMTPRLERESLSVARKTLAPGWHLYRIEFRGETVSVAIDGGEAVRVSEQSFMPGEFLGLWSESTALRVRNFRVIGL